MTPPYAPPQHHGPPTGPPTGPPYGPPTGPPPRNKALPWAIGVLVTLLAVAGVLVVLLLTRDDDAPAPPAAQSTASEATTAAPTPTDQGATPPGEEPYADDGGSITGSADRAAVFLDDVVLGDYENALGHGGSDFQAYYGGDADLLEEEILTATGGVQPVGYAVVGVEYDAEVDADVISVSAELPDGGTDDLVVLVGEEGTSTVVVGFA